MERGLRIRVASLSAAIPRVFIHAGARVSLLQTQILYHLTLMRPGGYGPYGDGSIFSMDSGDRRFGCSRYQ